MTTIDLNESDMRAWAASVVPEAVRARELAEEQLREARSLSLLTAEDYDEAAQLRSQIKGAADQAEAERVAQKAPHLAETRRIDAAFRPALETFSAAVTYIDKTMRDWRAAEEARRKATELKAREAAEKERLRLEKLAQKAQAKGLEDTADELARAADSVPVPVIETHVPKVEGLSARQTWRFEVTDESLIPREYLAVDEKAIGGAVRALKGKARIPGVRVWCEETFASRR